MNKIKGLATILFFLLVGCSNNIKNIEIPLFQPQNLKIGIIADTQITTKYRTSGYLFRNMRIDSLVNVAIRTTAQEHLAARHLGLMLNSIEEEGVDFILYLGDAVNSGCNDEIKIFFDELNSFRERSSIPTFITVGNHDYLATGNQADPIARVQACGEQGYLTKEELILELSTFNNESWLIAKNQNSIITNYIDSIIDPDSNVSAECRAASEEQQQEKGCYFASLLTVQTNTGESLQIALADTSDYKDVKFLPALSKYLGFFGLRGSVSWNDGQTDWFESHFSDSDNIRVIGSHYPVTKLGWSRFFVSRPGDLMLDEGYNIWLSAHTHEPSLSTDKTTFRYGSNSEGWKVTEHINIGSTTDFRPQMGIVDFSSGRAEKIVIPSLSSIEIIQCRVELSELTGLDGSILDYHLGLDKGYRKEGYDPEPIRENINAFLQNQEERRLGHWTRCLINLAAENEAG